MRTKPITLFFITLISLFFCDFPLLLSSYLPLGSYVFASDKNSAPAEAKTPVKRASVEVSAENKDGKTNLVFKTVPASGLAINAEGPWKLEIKSLTGLVTPKSEFKRPDWQSDISGFRVPATIQMKGPEAKVGYKMTTFICTKDKSMCYREVIEGESAVKITAN